MDLWHLPSTLVSAIAAARQSDVLASLPPAEQTLPRILRLAQLLADLVVDRRHPALERLKRERAVAGPLSSVQIQALVDVLEEKVEQLAGVFARELPPGLDYRDVLVEAHRQMSQVASELTGDWLNSATAARQLQPESELLAEIENLSTAAGRLALEPAPARRAKSDAILRADAAVAERDDGRWPTTTGAASAAKASGPNRSETSPAERTGDESRSAGGNAPAGGLQIYEAALDERLDVALAACRTKRAPLSLLLVEIDRFDPLIQAVGPIAAEQLVLRLGRFCRACDAPGSGALCVAQACFALVLPGCDRGDAVGQGDRLLAAFREYVRKQPNPAVAAATVSLGVATVPAPPNNFRVRDLVAAARRCLAAAQRSGNALKSIGIY